MMMYLFKKILLIFLTVLAIAFFLFIPPCSRVEHGAMNTPDKIAAVCDPGSKNQVHDALVKWVYEHSNRISRADCNEIVFEVMKSNKPLLLLALMEVESNFVPNAISNRGALGLTQVMPGIWEKDLITRGIILERRDLFNIGPSIAAGDYVLSVFLKEAKGDVAHTLEKYLGGRDGAYVKRIFGNLANLYIIVGEIK
jgi:hypothetical protein